MLDKKYNHQESEKKWQNYWRENETYKFQDDLSKDQTFVIDTPPPTVSGLLHMGHVFSYVQADFIARFQRMNGKDVFYPMGFDDNGLPTERLVEKVKKIRGNKMDREEFVKECESVVEEAEEQFEALFNSIALSVDWNEKYQTISKKSQALSQSSFVDLYQKGLVEKKFEPIIWDCIDQTALSQADLEEKEENSAMNFIDFEILENGDAENELRTHRDNVHAYPEIHKEENEPQNKSIHAHPEIHVKKEKLEIMTTRPELLGACVAVMINANHENENGDKKWKNLIKNQLDENNEGFTGSYAVTPLFGSVVPIFADNDVKTDKGTGAVMCCTFGDETDIKWYKKHNLDLRIILEKYGKISEFKNLKQFSFKDIYKEKFEKVHKFIANQKIVNARKIIISLLKAEPKVEILRPELVEEDTQKIKTEFLIENLENVLNKEEPIKHAVKCAERSGSPIEIIVEEQWFIKILDKKKELLAQIKKCNWFPDFMRIRAEQWVENLSWDWCISRQRFFGVPFPVWQISEFFEHEDYDNLEEFFEDNVYDTLVADFSDLPIDPLKSAPKDYKIIKEEINDKGQKYFLAEKNGEKKKYVIKPETDILDTWATSSISPQLSSGLVSDEMVENLVKSGAISENEAKAKTKRHEKLFPADLRPQAHEIIRTWAFYTITKSYLHNLDENGKPKENQENSIDKSIPWKNLMISGWCLASDKTKMSKSKGNVVTPTALIEEKGSDAVRYWTSTSNLGADTAYSDTVFKIGQKLVTKLFNAAKFAAMNFDLVQEIDENSISEKITEASDLWILSKLNKSIENSTKDFEKFEYAKAREKIEDFFWNDFCDNYLEIVKVRSYGLESQKLEGQNLSEDEKISVKNKQISAILTLKTCLNSLLKLFSPFVPHICEEIYSEIFKDEFSKTKSISARGNWPKAENYFYDKKYEEIGDEILKIIFEVRKYKSDNNLSMKTEINQLKISSKTDLSEALEDLKNVCGAKEIISEKGPELKIEIL